MSSKHQRLQYFIRQYRAETGKEEVDLHDVAKYAISKGWKPPTPASPVDLLARDFAQAAREEILRDDKTGHPYRVNHALRTTHGTKQLTLWVVIDRATRQQMKMSLTQRRDQMIGDGLQLTFDADHWNSVHPDEPSLAPEMNLTADIAERKLAPDEDEATG